MRSMERRWPNHSIERTSSGRLRLPAAAAHVERQTSVGFYEDCFVKGDLSRWYVFVTPEGSARAVRRPS
jgi:hypothetical protein